MVFIRLIKTGTRPMIKTADTTFIIIGFQVFPEA